MFSVVFALGGGAGSLHGGMKTRPQALRRYPLLKTALASAAAAATSALLTGCAFVTPGPATASLTHITVLPPLGAAGQGFMSRDGRGPFNYDLAEVVANTKANGADIPVYLDHATTGPAHGWIDHTADPVQGPDGGWDWPVTYTDEGAALLKSRAYRYTSIGFYYVQDEAVAGRPAGRIVAFYENSLVTRPAFPVRAIASTTPGAGYTSHQPSTPATTPMTAEQLALLGLTETATAAEITAALQALTAGAALAGAVASAAGAPAGADAAAVLEAAVASQVAAGAVVAATAHAAVVAELATATAAADAAKSELAAIRAQHAEQTATAAVDAAITAGKFTPAAREVLLAQAKANLDGFTALAAAMPTHPAVQSQQAAQQPGPALTPGEASAPDSDYATSVLGIAPATFAAGKA